MHTHVHKQVQAHLKTCTTHVYTVQIQYSHMNQYVGIWSAWLQFIFKITAKQCQYGQTQMLMHNINQCCSPSFPDKTSWLLVDTWHLPNVQHTRCTFSRDVVGRWRRGNVPLDQSGNSYSWWVKQDLKGCHNHGECREMFPEECHGWIWVVSEKSDVGGRIMD